MGKSSKNIHPKQSRQKQNKNINIKPTTKSKNKSELASLLTSCSSLCLLQNAWGSIYMAFMGDPTLRLFVVAPPTAAVAVQSQNTVRYALSRSHYLFFCIPLVLATLGSLPVHYRPIPPQLLNYYRLSWTASTDAAVLGYYVYRAAGSIQSKFTKITPTLVTGKQHFHIYIYIKDWRGVRAEHQDLTINEQVVRLWTQHLSAEPPCTW